MLGSLRRLLPGSLLPLCLVSCSSFAFERQAIGVHHDAETDVLELRILYGGVHASQKTSADDVRSIAGGKRHFIVFDWPLDFDLERIGELPPEDQADEAFPDPETTQRIVAFLRAVEVSNAELFLDGSGRLCLFHEVHVPALREGIGLLNEVLRAAVRVDETEGDLGELDARSRELLVDFVEAGEDFVHLGADGLVIRLPFSRAQCALLVREAFGQRSGGQGERALLSAILDFLRDLRVDETGVKLVFGRVDDQPPILYFEHPERSYSPDVLESLEGLTLEVRDDEAIAALLRP